jgi:HEAT repeat protein
MKIPLCHTASITALLFCTAALVSCSKEEEFNKNINVSAMIQQLKGQDKDQKVNACTALAEAGPNAAEAVATLTQALKDDDPLVRRLAAYALGKIGPKAASAVPALKELFNDSDVSVMRNALIAVRSIKPSEVPAVKIDNVMTDTAPK